VHIVDTKLQKKSMSYYATRKNILACYARTTNSVSHIHPPSIPQSIPLFPTRTNPLAHTANLVLTECHERLTARNPSITSDTSPRWLLHDVKLPGVMTIRGENVTICATVDLDREETPRGARFTEEDEVRGLAEVQRAEKREAEARRARVLRDAGVEVGFGMQTV